MNSIDPAARLGDLVIAQPRRARLLERLRLDFCCGGARTLAEACAQRQLDVDTIVAVLAAFDADRADGAVEPHDVGRASIGELCDHIVKAHHEPLRRELPRIADRFATVVRVHGDQQPQLRDLRRLFEGMRRELEHHLGIEEATLFPACRSFEAGVGARVDDALLDAHEADHANVGEALVALRELSDGYRTERALCGTHRALMESLHELELELHQHVHEENNILFPRVRGLVRS